MSHLKMLVSLMLLFLVFSMRVIVSQHLFPFMKVYDILLNSFGLSMSVDKSMSLLQD